MGAEKYHLPGFKFFCKNTLIAFCWTNHIYLHAAWTTKCWWWYSKRSVGTNLVSMMNYYPLIGSFHFFFWELNFHDNDELSASKQSLICLNSTISNAKDLLESMNWSPMVYFTLYLYSATCRMFLVTRKRGQFARFSLYVPAYLK